MNTEPKNCDSVQVTLKVLGGKWKPIILYLLSGGTFRFGQLKRNVTGITQKMLTQELREMENDRLVLRKVFAQVPLKVEYSITAYGKTLEPILKQMSVWGKAHKSRVN